MDSKVCQFKCLFKKMHRSWAEGELVINTAGKVRGKFFHERNMLDTSNSIYSNFPVNRKSRKLNISPSRDEGTGGADYKCSIELSPLR